MSEIIVAGEKREPTDRPIAFRILVKARQIKRYSEAGMDMFGSDEVHELHQRQNDIGTVVAIGDSAFKLDRFDNACPLNVGDTIRFKQYAGHIFREKDDLGRPVSEWYHIINDDDVLSIIEESGDA